MTDWPLTDGLGVDVRAVVVGPWFTWVSEPVEATKLLVALEKVAVMVCEPGWVKALSTHVAPCVPSETGEHSTVVPSSNVTVPVGVPAPGALAATVAV